MAACAKRENAQRERFTVKSEMALNGWWLLQPTERKLDDRCFEAKFCLRASI
jgi:hypothetical protein